MSQEVTADLVRQLLHYDPETGAFTWRVAIGRRIRPGRAAGSHNGKGHLRCGIYGKAYKLHRLAWLHTHGVWPVDQIDHINGDRADNRIENLREATNSQNQFNKKIERKVRIQGRN